MYIPKNMALDDKQAIAELIADFGFGLLISPTLEATHLPLLYEPAEDGQGYLYGHMAKANEHWKQLDGQQVLVVFSGPHAYISPTWYANGPAVPTWNYAAVHCTGRVEILEDNGTATAIQKLMKKYEPNLLADKALMPEEYIDKLSQAIVGFRVVISSIQAKEKLGQHRKVADQIGVYHALAQNVSTDSRALAKYMLKRNLGTGRNKEE
ncbi:MAG: FMN-binding negative transcriptional regulator [Shewanella sp.]|uniref:FMN-binding negative transcriptional regulator n=1 Tax=Shewanella cutis TaxID=2766780 RepID=A0ABS9QZY0_9GAMM|nr:FMN-binding negative transcriptional regulator [Shewanella sp. PS-2]MCG9965078.1 FMN-binding negative transcriptional regulator [Shewanella sp. PS-2]